MRRKFLTLKKRETETCFEYLAKKCGPNTVNDKNTMRFYNITTHIFSIDVLNYVQRKGKKMQFCLRISHSICFRLKKVPCDNLSRKQSLKID